ncbi:NTP transferase domain-containing protein [Candidatus Woesearchaeota archaeon]|nr:NTP transferase domain-containing protein [Candidatus Woesearchaeota archaeon]
MKAVILCAGYGTRLKPLTNDTSKSLLPVAGKPLINHIIDRLAEIDQITIVTNSLYYQKFVEWQSHNTFPIPLRILSNGKTNGELNGAVRDMQLGLESIDDDVLVMAGDTLFEFNLPHFVDKFRKSKTTTVAVQKEQDVERVKKANEVCLDGSRIVHFKEKPAQPTSMHTAASMYLIPRADIGSISKFLADPESNPSNAGNYIEWLHTRQPVHAYVFSERRWNIDTLEEYMDVNRLYSDHRK